MRLDHISENGEKFLSDVGRGIGQVIVLLTVSALLNVSRKQTEIERSAELDRTENCEKLFETLFTGAKQAVLMNFSKLLPIVTKTAK